MQDSKLADLAAKYFELKRREERIKSKREDIGYILVKELERRETAGIDTGGWQVTYVQQHITTYSEDELRKRLKTKFKLVTKLVLDKDKLSAAVQEGLVDAKVVEQCATVTPKRAYVLVNPSKEP